MDKNTPPFKPGDTVVRVITSSHPGMVEGNTYTVNDVYWCCSVMKWRVQLAGIHCRGTCGGCSQHNSGWLAANFRKADDLSDHTVESLLEELSEPVKSHHYV